MNKTEQLNSTLIQRNLDFEPESLWPASLPCYSFQGELLCGFQTNENDLWDATQTPPQPKTVKLEGNSLPQFLKGIYPQLSFMELSRLSEKIKQHPQLNDLQHLMELWFLYGYRNYENSQSLIEKIVTLPKEVQKWIHQKKLSPQDLAPLNALTTPDSLSLLEPLWLTFIDCGFSKSEGVKGLEYLVELLLLGNSVEDLRPPHSPCSSAQWLDFLHSKRFPMSTHQDKMAEEKIRVVFWPKKMESRWVRRGDRAGVELKVFFTHPDELKQNLVGLERTYQDIKNNPQLDDLWAKK